MLTYDDALNLNYYKKTTFTGWMNGMRFLIKREEPVIKEATEDTPEEKGEPIFHAWIWPGPYIFDLTDDSKKTDNTFPLQMTVKNSVQTGLMKLSVRTQTNIRKIKQMEKTRFRNVINNIDTPETK